MVVGGAIGRGISPFAKGSLPTPSKFNRKFSIVIAAGANVVETLDGCSLGFSDLSALGAIETARGRKLGLSLGRLEGPLEDATAGVGKLDSVSVGILVVVGAADTDGTAETETDGLLLGLTDGIEVGWPEVNRVGDTLGLFDGASDGKPLVLGGFDDSFVGDSDPTILGPCDGALEEGDLLG